MFIPVNSAALLKALEHSLSTLSSDYRDVYHNQEQLVARSLTPAKFDAVLHDIVMLSRRDAGIGGLVATTPDRNDAIRAATSTILSLVARWTPPADRDAMAWELALAAAPARDAI